MTTPVDEPDVPELPPVLQPHPIPVGFNIGSHPSGFVVIQFLDATGTRFIFLDKDTAKSFQESLNRAVGSVSTGLYLP